MSATSLLWDFEHRKLAAPGTSGAAQGMDLCSTAGDKHLYLYLRFGSRRAPRSDRAENASSTRIRAMGVGAYTLAFRRRTPPR